MLNCTAYYLWDIVIFCVFYLNLFVKEQEVSKDFKH